MNTSLTICAACQHFLRRGAQWYGQFCMASPLEETVDFVTGERGYRTTNDLDMVIFTEHQYAYARNINTDGHCPLYEERI